MFDFLTQKFSSIFFSFNRNSRLTTENIATTLEQVQDSLLEADVPLSTVQEFIATVQKEVLGQKIVASMKPAEQFIKIIHDRMVAFLGGAYLQETFAFQIPSVVLMMGLQGSGKTTTIGKLAYFIKAQAEKRGKSRKILCASVDFYRPAAIDQLEIVAKQAGVDFYRATNLNPIEATQEIYEYFKRNNYEHLLFDTAGRLQVDDVMMEELVQIKKILQPKYNFIVLDGMTGQESLSIAQAYENKVGFDSAILSKMDSGARGGAAFAFRYVLKKPICFVGVGEKLQNLEIFRPERVAKRLLGMGDMLTLIENAQDKIKQADQEKMTKAMLSGEITLDDFAQQLNMVSKLGSISSILKFMPGMGNVSIPSAEVQKGENELKKFRVILSSMTRKEREKPAILQDASRKKRIAKGAGVDVVAVNLLLQRFEQSKQFVKLLKKNRFFDK
ncbi:signal recognition particle protein [Candidatus Babeliales bacterium]|nr:signal recognition particle protein [Candidatus Babeliales bacterium]